MTKLESLYERSSLLERAVDLLSTILETDNKVDYSDDRAVQRLIDRSLEYKS